MDKARKYLHTALQIKESDGLRIKMALLMPPIFSSAKEMRKRWDDMLVSLKQLANRNLVLPGGAFVWMMMIMIVMIVMIPMLLLAL